MRHTFYWLGIETTIARFVEKCATCKRAKEHGRKQDCGLLSPQTPKSVNPFDIVHVDLTGPY
ncbi:hypothetical protein PF005_g13221 [Phytophthora fragariae]|uniref:Integrase zinc-binding domain-containing protein n=2 Tax=Phytophthora TaxID=4783 RepID=A0A6A3EFC5_9STRA|nr:hypothetical protein PF003_g6365 [Phytophthora fragariae]KAE9000460.1 hypothetical protein PR002_g18181 [Phytophthora rubi]KAE8928808.1 hypothetical protein PF009_g21063 [Phytophthora fragariae]KAE9001354.1 hypothetical protein PF011_g13782 [Phytophthora fragariae]KAE9018498.1 hypothetical protein PR001_g14122 [Phytophthora rubi]